MCLNLLHIVGINGTIFAIVRQIDTHVEKVEDLGSFQNTTLSLLALILQKSLNVSYPGWYTPEIHEDIRAAAKLYLDTLSYTPTLSRLNGGSLARRLVENMNVKDKKPANTRKVYLYSGHEFTIYALAKAHGVTLKESPGYGSALVLEKLRNERGKLFVRVSCCFAFGDCWMG